MKTPSSGLAGVKSLREIALVDHVEPKPKGWPRLVVQLGAFVLVLGIPDGSLGVLWPSMRATFDLPLAELGLLAAGTTALYIVGGLLAARLAGWLGVARATVAACFLACLCLAACAAAPAFALVLASFAVLGLAKGVIDAVENADAALDGGVRLLGLLHGSWAVGGMLGPLLVAVVLATSHDWRLALAITAIAVGALAVFALVERRSLQPRSDLVPTLSTEVPLETGAGLSVGAEPSRDIGPAPQAARRALVLTLVAFVVYTAAEGGSIAWGYTYMIDARHISRTAAALAMALFWAALTGGRFGLAGIGERLVPTRILEGSCLLLACGTFMFWVLPGASCVAGLPVAGLGSAAVFPVLVALTPERVGVAGTGRAVGASIAASGLGGPVAIALFGVLAAHLGVPVIGPCLFAAAALMYVVNRVLTAATRRLPA